MYCQHFFGVAELLDVLCTNDMNSLKLMSYEHGNVGKICKLCHKAVTVIDLCTWLFKRCSALRHEQHSTSLCSVGSGSRREKAVERIVDPFFSKKRFFALSNKYYNNSKNNYNNRNELAFICSICLSLSVPILFCLDRKAWKLLLVSLPASLLCRRGAGSFIPKYAEGVRISYCSCLAMACWQGQ